LRFGAASRDEALESLASSVAITGRERTVLAAYNLVVVNMKILNLSENFTA
jgi:hypothetical protein